MKACSFRLEFSVFKACLRTVMPSGKTQEFRVFVATWNVGGKSPHNRLNLDDLLQINNQSDIYVLGFQEIVPLNAGNVLVAEDNEPPTKWLALINQSLNKPQKVFSREPKSFSQLCTSLLFQKPSLKKACKNFRAERKSRLKTCNCNNHILERKNSKDCCLWLQPTNFSEDEFSMEIDDDGIDSYCGNQMRYSLIVGKQMVGIFVTIWVKKELVQHVSHLRISSVGRGILGCFGNKGCVSVSMTFHHTSFCFVCSHLASGEKEGDELRRNLDVIEILKNTQFQRICRSSNTRVPEKIIEHEISLSYSETRKLLEHYDWNPLFDKDQLKIEREAGRVFKGWREGKIYFAPTYKYCCNSDTYAGDTSDTKNKRRTPAWCDRILWHGNGIRQLLYVRWESRFSDHRPVCSTFIVDVEVTDDELKKRSSSFGSEDYLPLTRK